MEIHQLIKKYREKAGLTQEEVAKQLFVQRSTYTHYESGTRRVNAETFFKILAILNIDISLKDKTKYEWVLSYEDLENNKEKESVIISIFEEDNGYKIDVFEMVGEKKGELILSGSEAGVQGYTYEKASIHYILEREIQPEYNIKKIEYLKFDDIVVEPPTGQGTGRKSFSVGMIERLITKMLYDKYGKLIKYNFFLDPEWGTPECKFGEDEDTKFVLLQLFLEYNPDIKKEITERIHESLSNDSLESLIHYVELYDKKAIQKEKEESDEAFIKRIHQLYSDYFRSRYIESSLEYFTEELTSLLLGKILNKKVKRYTMDPYYSDVIHVFC